MAATPNLLDDEQEAPGQAVGADATVNEAPELTLDPNLLAQIAPSKIVEPCPKCGAAMPDEPMPWCRACGYYPKLGTYFDPDDAAAGAAARAGALREIPQWAYVLVGGLLFTLFTSLAVRFTTHPLSPLRFYWAMGQIICGLTAFVAAHMLCFMFASTEDATIGLMDPILRPINIWKPTICILPRSFRRVATGAWGLGAVVCALFIGGIPWEKLTDWGDPAPRRKTSLVNAITNRARQAESTSDNLEDAVKDFAGPSGDVKPEEEPVEDPTKRTHEAECVIVGYIPSAVDPQDFVALLVASDFKGKLKIVAQVSDGIPDGVHNSISAQLRELKRERPFIPSRIDAVWVQPKLFCRIGFNDYNSSNRMKEPLFREVLMTPSAAK